MNKLHYLDINCNLIFHFGWRKKIWSETLKEQYDLYVDMIIWPMNFVIYAPCVYKRLNSWLLLHEKLTIIQLISHVSGLYEWISLSLWSCTKYKACACFLPLARYHRSPSQRCTHTHTHARAYAIPKTQCKIWSRGFNIWSFMAGGRMSFLPIRQNRLLYSQMDIIG